MLLFIPHFLGRKLDGADRVRTELLLRFIAGQDAAKRYPRNLVPSATVADPKILPVHMLYADLLVFELLIGRWRLIFIVRVIISYWRGRHFDACQIPKARDPPAWQQRIEHIIAHRGIKTRIIDHYVQCPLQNLRNRLTQRVLVAESAAHIGLRDAVVDRSPQNLGVGPQDVERVLALVLASIALDDALGLLAPLAFAARSQL